jgi:hypothetical protein
MKLRCFFRELEPDYVAALRGIIAVEAILVTQPSGTPVAENVFDIVGDEDLTEIARAKAWARNSGCIWEKHVS